MIKFSIHPFYPQPLLALLFIRGKQWATAIQPHDMTGGRLVETVGSSVVGHGFHIHIDVLGFNMNENIINSNML